VFGFSATTLLMFALFGSGAGLLAGLLGIGGGILLVPLFLWGFPLAGLDPEIVVHSALATSLAIILPTSISSTLGHRKRGNVNWQQVSCLAAGGVVGAFFGGWLAAMLPGRWLQLCFGVMQIVVATRMYRARKYLPPEDPTGVGRRLLVVIGFVGGCFSAFFGVGGGVIAVPLMVIVARLPIHLAVGNSSALIVISSLCGALSYVLHGQGIPQLPAYSFGYVNQVVAVLVAPFTIVFARLGVRIAAHLPHDKMTRIFAFLLVLVGLRIIWKVISLF